MYRIFLKLQQIMYTIGNLKLVEIFLPEINFVLSLLNNLLSTGNI